MIESVSEILVRYAETDMMGIVYHANFLTWLEISRTKLLKERGYPYTELEAQNIFLPVLEVNIKYLRPARYDESVTIVTRIKDRPMARIRLEYEVTRGEELLATGNTVHAFVNKAGRPVKAPRDFLAKFHNAFGP